MSAPATPNEPAPIVQGATVSNEVALLEITERAALARRGQSFGFAALVLILATVIILGMNGHDWLAGGIGGSYLFSVVGLFITGRYSSTDKLKDWNSRPV